MSFQGGESTLAEPARKIRETAREIFLHALSECSIAKSFERQVQLDRGILRVGADLYDLAAFSGVFAVSMGKAAHTMAEALASQLGSLVTGIVVCSTPPPAQLPGFHYFLGGHPVPNAESLHAAEAILNSLAILSPRSLVILLISGGASAMVEKPIDDSIGLADLVETYQALVHCGASIREVNAIRKHLSAIKGGRLAQAAWPAQQISILVSDVPDGALDALASGPGMPDSTTVQDCYRIAEQHDLTKRLPSPVRALFEKRLLQETPKFGDSAFERSRDVTILSNEIARNAAITQAALAGFAVEVDNTVDDWDYQAAADHLLAKLRRLRRGASRVCLISGGELTVKIDGPAGTGGRNQQFALYCAARIHDENITVLSAGTDGIDGNSPAAGAVVDGSTLQRAAESGLNVQNSLNRFDAFPLLNALGDSIITGPTGNNVRDLRILLAY